MQFTIIFLLLFCLGEAAQAASFGEVRQVRGNAVIGVNPLKAGDKVNVNDVITTGARSFVRVLLQGGIALQVGPDSTVRLEQEEGKTISLNLVKGFLLSRIKKLDNPPDQPRYRVRTASASLGVRGTTFFAKEEADGRIFLCVCDGTVEAKWEGGVEKITAKGHHTPKWISRGKHLAEAAPMGSDHSDAEIADLEKLLE